MAYRPLHGEAQSRRTALAGHEHLLVPRQRPVVDRQPGLLILDEPTSQMAPRGEHQFFEQIKTIATDRITIMVTHRPENTKIADHVIVKEHGRITEQGRYGDQRRRNLPRTPGTLPRTTHL